MTDGFRGITRGECDKNMPTVWAIRFFEVELSFLFYLDSFRIIFLGGRAWNTIIGAVL